MERNEQLRHLSEPHETCPLETGAMIDSLTQLERGATQKSGIDPRQSRQEIDGQERTCASKGFQHRR